MSKGAEFQVSGFGCQVEGNLYQPEKRAGGSSLNLEKIRLVAAKGIYRRNFFLESTAR